jgi:hypothetical protein
MEDNIEKITEEFNNQTNLIDGSEQVAVEGDLQTQILELLDKVTNLNLLNLTKLKIKF